MNTTITIKDYPCGSGKTTSMIKSFKQEEKYLVILSYLSEVDRIIEDTTDVSFVEPVAEDNIQNTKTESLKDLLLTGRNVATTHSMYERLVPLAEEGLLDDYNIIIDEVPEVVKAVSTKSKTSIKEFYVNSGFIEVEDNGLVLATDKWREKKEEVADTLSNKILTYAETGCLYLLGEHMFIWAMPSKLLSAGKSVTILTYKAEGSLLVSYMRKLSLPYLIQSNKYKEEAFREQAAELINLQDIPSISKLKLSHTGQQEGMRSSNYYSKLSCGLKNLRSRQLKGLDLSNVLLTCKKDAWIQNNGKAGVFAQGSKMFENTNWIANTTRGTNEYAHCSHLIYLYDQNINKLLARWLNDESRHFNDAYALTELIQWVWRSRIRKGEPITLYLPAPRMRSIFIDWLEGWDTKGFGEYSVAA
jgi:hypothetical protein